MVELTINGHKGKFPEGKTLLECIEEVGLKVPTLCFHKALSPYGACRLCLVEVTQNGRTTIQTSCTYPALDGLVVETDTERVLKNRKIIIELLLARCPDSEEIRNLAKELGVEKTRIKPKNEDCVLCGLCVRMCEERMGRGAISFAGRGPARQVISPFGDPNEVCQTCGACDFICPTGKIAITAYSKNTPKPILSEYNRGLISRSAAYIPYPQAIPNKATIDARYCVHLLRGECKVCTEFCEADAINFDQKEETDTIDVGAVILSPGYDHFDPGEKTEYSYLRSPNVVTAVEFERILSATGPYRGHLLRPSDQTPPKKIAFIQCVGSRDNKHDYCSSICCMYATKEAIIAKEHSHDPLECHIYYMDLRAFGKGFDEYYTRAQELGIKYIPSRPSAVEPVLSKVEEAVKETGNLLVEYVSEDGNVKHEEYDMVVLSTGVVPPGSAEQIRDVFDVRLNKHGFCRTTEFNPMDSSREGVFASGPFTEPKDIPETVTQASGTAARAMELLADVRGTMIASKEYPPEKDISDQEPRIGVFVCHCGINIGGIVNVPEVMEYARTLPNVVYAEENLYTCSNDTQRTIKEIIEEHDLNRVIVSSCTPRTHEPLFQETIREAGLNRHLFEMANIRDQCSWIHMNTPEEATQKAKDLTRMAVAKIRLVEPLPTIPLDVTQSAVVIGGGPAGMSTALSLANQGFPVALIEKDSQLGGNLRKVLHFIDGKSTVNLLEHIVNEVTNHPNITVHLSSTLHSIEGFVGNYKTTLEPHNGDEPVEIEHGVAIIATGSIESVPDEYLYGKDQRIKTGLEFEKVLEEQDSKDLPDRVVFIQCVGSREDEHPYCSRVCCRETVKNALALKKKKPSAEVFVLYRDIRTYGFSDSYYQKARDLGIVFLRYEADEKPAISTKGDGLEVKVKDLQLGAHLLIQPDMVVLAARIDPAPDNEILSQFFKVPLNHDGFFLEAHVKLRPVDFATEGVFLAGMVHSPKTIAESIAQGKAAAARAATIISKDKYEAEATIAAVNEDICDGCAICVGVCEYNALEVIERSDGTKIVELQEAVCKGCGCCVAACPSGAMEQKGFKNDQIMAEIDAALI